MRSAEEGEQEVFPVAGARGGQSLERVEAQRPGSSRAVQGPALGKPYPTRSWSRGLEQTKISESSLKRLCGGRKEHRRQRRGNP